jgi:hypothetical protein
MKHKIYLALILICFLSLAKAQMAIGKPDVDGNSALLDFAENDTITKGIILPAVTTKDVVALTNGTFIFDSNTATVNVYENDTWVDLSEPGLGNSTTLISNNTDDTGEGVIIGAETSTANGVLVLEDDGKAMVLPKIDNPAQNVKSPYPGMICYDTSTKALTVFDGTHWYYWR